MTLMMAFLALNVDVLFIGPLVTSKEFCQFDNFNATCLDGPSMIERNNLKTRKVILMKEARYGRIAIGRCVTRDYGYLGCSADVIDDLDSFCSGRTHCQLAVPLFRDLVHPCPRDLTSYLEASYECVEVVSAESSSSSSAPPTRSSPSQSSSILQQSSSSSSSSKCQEGQISSFPVYMDIDEGLFIRNSPDRVTCPLTLRCSEGQSIVIGVYSFSQNNPPSYFPHSFHHDTTPSDLTSQANHLLEDKCHVILEVLEIPKNSRNEKPLTLPLCRHNQRFQHLFKSKTESIKIRGVWNFDGSKFSTGMKITEENTPGRIYLVEFKVVGCPTPRSPSNGWLERSGKKLRIFCNFSGDSFHVSCEDDSWIGRINDCPPASSVEMQGFEEEKYLPLGLVLAVAAGVVMGTIFGCVALVTSCALKKSTDRAAQSLSRGKDYIQVSDCDPQDFHHNNHNNHNNRNSNFSTPIWKPHSTSWTNSIDEFTSASKYFRGEQKRNISSSGTCHQSTNSGNSLPSFVPSFHPSISLSRNSIIVDSEAHHSHQQQQQHQQLPHQHHHHQRQLQLNLRSNFDSIDETKFNEG